MGIAEQYIEKKCTLTELNDKENRSENINKMIQKLMDIYELSKLNTGKPECIFPETQIFNEAWLLRGILNGLIDVKDIKDKDSLDFLPFPNDSKQYSEGRLNTLFKPIKRGDKTSTESQTPIDGIVGDFEIDETTKSGIKILDNFNYLSIFEAKMYSPITARSQNESKFSQVTRIISCMIFQIMKVEKLEGKKIFLVIFYPKDHKNIDPLKYSKEFIKDEIKGRLLKYRNGGNEDFRKFESKYEKIIDSINLRFIHWETVLNEIKEDALINKFYNLCKEFNKKDNEEYPLKVYPNTLDELRKQCPVKHKKSLKWVDTNCISTIETPQKCITTGRSGGLPVITSDGFFVNLSPRYNLEFWEKLRLLN